MQKYFLTGIGTDIGKTIVAATLVEAWEADYWKPVQTGDLSFGDSRKVRSLLSNPKSKIHPEAVMLRNGISPHAAAPMDGTHIELKNFKLPETDNHLLIESAGGVMVPLNQKDLMVDLIEHLGCEVILVSRNYLGSINHTLLTVEFLNKRKIPIKGIIFNDETMYPACEEIILSYTGLPCIGRIPRLSDITPEVVRMIGQQFKGLPEKWSKHDSVV
ncbi:MAG: dethiobiotin synthase [Flavobacteriales bacterium]|nr:dethiobiotin synthase [Flavobacteriales bacterium]MCB9448247.1 dethiobiotin synthase [Flavobacteriales bacterium]